MIFIFSDFEQVERIYNDMAYTSPQFFFVSILQLSHFIKFFIYEVKKPSKF